MEIQKFASLAEIQGIVGYVGRISKVESKNPRLVGYYRFKDFIHCARSECNRSHGFGYVVQTEAGEVIGIGNRCGAKLFGKGIWTTVSAGFAKQIRRYELRESLIVQLAALPEVLTRIESLIHGDGGAKWLERAHYSLLAICPSSVIRQLELRVSRRDADITVAKEIDRENQTRLGFTRDAEYETDTIGTFAGLGALASPSPRIVLFEQLLTPLRTFLGVGADELMQKMSRLRYFQDLQASLEGKLRTAERRLQDAQLFFATANLRLLRHLAQNPNDRTMLGRVVWNGTAGKVEVERNS